MESRDATCLPAFEKPAARAMAVGLARIAAAYTAFVRMLDKRRQPGDRP